MAKVPFKYGKIEEMSDDADIKYWQSQSDEAKFAEAWRLVELAFALKGLDKSELGFQRSIASLQRQESLVPYLNCTNAKLR